MARNKTAVKNRSKSTKNSTATAPKKKIKTSKSPSKPGALKRISSDSRTPKIIGFFLIILGLFFLVSSVGHYLSYAHDAALLEVSPELSSNDTSVQFKNPLGKLGALAGELSIRTGFGIASLIIGVLITLSGLSVLNKLPQFKMGSIWAKGIFMTFWLAIAVSFPFLSEVTESSGVSIIQDKYLLGGGMGFGLSLWLKNAVGTFGTALILLFTLGTFLILAYDGLLSKFSFSFSSIFSKKESIDSEMEEKPIASGQNRARNESIIGEIPPVDEKNIATPSEEEIIEETIENILNDDPDEEQSEVTSEMDKLIDDIGSEPTESEFEDVITTSPSEPSPEDTEEMDVLITADKEEEVLTEDEIDEKVQEFGEYDPKLDLSRYELPNIDLLVEHGSGQVQINKDELEANKNKIVETLNNYKIEISKIKATVGPTVTLYEIIPAPGVRISKIKNLEDDIALSLAALGIRIIAPIPGKGTIGIEVPNSDPQIVSMKKLIASDKFQNTKMELPVALGKTISNETLIADLAKMPHLLMAGATGQGKSVGLNAILVSLLYKKHPAQIKFVLVDPKKVELTLFNKIERHYLAMLPDEEEAIITDTSKVVKTLNSLCVEMDARYELLKQAMVRNIKEYNAKFIQRKLNPENGHKYMPYIVLVVDEFADLIMTAGKEVETPIARLAQLARAIGIHLIIATQRPSVNIITGTIKANFPARIAFRVTSKIDSRTILDAGGADQLIGRGDMLYSTGSDLIRLQCGFVDTPEVDEICDFIGSQQGYPSAFILPEFIDENASEVGNIAAEDRDAMFAEAARVIVMHQQGSTSLIQRKLKLGYNRAGRIIDQLEAAGIVGPFEGSKARKVLVPDEYSLEQLLGNE